MKIAIIGFGREGQSVYKYLKSDAEYRKSEIWILDQNKEILLPYGIKSRLGPDYLDNLEQFGLIFRSPGVLLREIKDSPLRQGFEGQVRLKIKEIKQKTFKISSATIIFFDKCPCPIIGVTGTKGKTTTSTLIYKILKNCGWDAYLAGNIGEPALNILPKLKRKSIVILELSSFQLQDLRKSPQITVVLEIFPDHQDAHLDLKEYVEAKSQIARHQKPGDKIFYYPNNRHGTRIAKLSPGEKIAIDETAFNPLTTSRLLIPGHHNMRNALTAFYVAQSLGCPTDKILNTIVNFKGVEHRLEFVKQIDGINFYNDSASTNPGTTIAAAQSFQEPKILIAGGKDKNLSYEKWPKIFNVNKVRTVILVGENSTKIYKIFEAFKFKSLKFKVTRVEDLKEAVILAKKIAPLCGAKIVLLSPGAASFDMFQNYAERGKAFKLLLR